MAKGSARGNLFIRSGGCVSAFAELGRPEKALELFQLCSPVTRASNREKAENYKMEPYVALADIYSHPSHIGGGGWP